MKEHLEKFIHSTLRNPLTSDIEAILACFHVEQLARGEYFKRETEICKKVGLMWEPMAVAIMIGLLFATVITLLFVPVLYKLFFRFKPE